jgi:ribosome biogenesis GTPase
VAANVDQVVVVFAAANPEPHPRMLDRFLVIAEANDLKARIVINKVELVGGVGAAHERWSLYERVGYPVHYTSVKQRLGLEELHDAFAGVVSALTGPSGVGKSSLLNAMFAGLDLRVGEISESVNKGRHTTVGAYLHPLPDAKGGYVADTPGLREVGMWALSPTELDQCFPELRPFLTECRFADCRHSVEPDCAVREAVSRGDVSVARYESFIKLREELEGVKPSRYRLSEGFPSESRGLLVYQLPRSPATSITFAMRSAAWRQLVWTASCAASASPASMASIIASCSATDALMSLVSMLMYMRM